jgi:hypothetical protein
MALPERLRRLHQHRPAALRLGQDRGLHQGHGRRAQPPHPAEWFTSVPKGGIIILAGRHAFGCLDDAAVPRDILNAKDRGAILVVLDPIFTADAAKADWWIPIKPSGDTALFTGMTHHIVMNGLYDKGSSRTGSARAISRSSRTTSPTRPPRP